MNGRRGTHRWRQAAIAVVACAVASIVLPSCSDAGSGVDVSRSDRGTAGAPAGTAAPGSTDGTDGTDGTDASGAAPGTEPAAPTTTAPPLTVDDLALADMTTGLTGLLSYHQDLVINVLDGTESVSLETTSADVWPGRAAIVTDTVVDADNVTSMRVGGFVDGTVFTAQDGGACSVTWTGDTAAADAPSTAAAVAAGVEPALRLPPLLTWTPGATTEVEGRPAITGTGTTVQGEVAGVATLVIDDTGVVLSYGLTLTAEDVSATYAYSLSSIGALVEPALPAGCPEPLIGIPAVDGATSVQRVPGMLDYATTQDPSAVADFYRSTMPTLGWTADGEATGDPPHLRLWFAGADGSEAIVLVTAGAGSTWVDVTIRPG